MSNQFTFLMSKILADEASEEEKEIFSRLLSDNDNRMIYMELKEYWDADMQTLYPTDKNELQTRVYAKLKDIERNKLKKLFARAASVAAVFFIVACTFAYLFFTKPEQLFTYSAQATPVEYNLPDGTAVMLNKNSQLTFNSNFGKEKRYVQLKGEAFFRVSKDKYKPFLVDASGTLTRVLGTTFNVKTGEKTVTTTLVEGSVLFYSDEYSVMLKPGEEVVCNLLSGKLKKYSTDPQLNTAWVKGRFNYSNLSFYTLSIKLEQIYGYKITIDNNRIASRVVSASFSTEEPIEEIMKALENEVQFNYLINTDKKQIFITSRTF